MILIVFTFFVQIFFNPLVFASIPDDLAEATRLRQQFYQTYPRNLEETVLRAVPLYQQILNLDQETLLPLEKASYEMYRAQAFLGLAQVRMLDEMRPYRDGIERIYYREGLEIARKLGAESLIAEILVGLGDANTDDALQCYLEASEIARRLREWRLLAEAQLGLCQHAEALDRLGHCSEGLELAYRLNDSRLIAKARIYLADVQAVGSDHKRINTVSGLVLARKIHDRRLIAKALLLSAPERWVSNKSKYYREALQIGQALEEPLFIAEAFVGLARERRIDPKEAYSQGLRIVHRLPGMVAKRIRAEALLGMTRVPMLLSLEIKRNHYYEALQLGRELKHPAFIAESLLGLAFTNAPDRVDYLYEALRMAEESQELSWKVAALLGLALQRVPGEEDCLRQAVTLACDLNHHELIGRGVVGVASYLKRMQRHAEAIEFYKAGLALQKISPRLRGRITKLKKNTERFMMLGLTKQLVKIHLVGEEDSAVQENRLPRRGAQQASLPLELPHALDEKFSEMHLVDDAGAGLELIETIFGHLSLSGSDTQEE